MTLSNMIEIVSAILIPGIIVGITALIKLNQTPMTLTLMEHNERQMHTFREKAAMYFAVFLGCFVLGFACNCFAHPNFVSEFENESVITEAKVDSEQGDKEDKGQSSNEETTFDVGAFSINIAVITIAFAVIGGIATKIKAVRSGNQFFTLKYFEKYFLRTAMITCIVGSIIAIILSAFDMNFKTHLFMATFLSFLAVTALILIRENDPTKDTRKKAYLKTYYNGRIVYLFETKGEYLIAGDDEYYEQSVDFWFIKLEDLKNMVVTALETELLFINSKELTITNNTGLSDNTVMDFVGYDFYKNTGNHHNIPTDKKITITANSVDDISYRIQEVPSEHTVQVKSVDRNEWKTAIIINKTA
ncbi:hypothetical protein SAMN02910384_03315 [Pseudobutyrivibrio sp. ACV-2]|uniref:hypothetical protein n=1 Tax=Pseudobutyrivibrio sp. ACV-2 TaxID=1520801 RepID=UPI00089D6C76|nr:hypothetical protein [Pseudobutyrivibrio sp. ACV-2]SEB07162.1 hypothetical protein SAMN02910384_03315 [Pseudobutyrivibrio sp. ACV-2]